MVFVVKFAVYYLSILGLVPMVIFAVSNPLVVNDWLLYVFATIMVLNMSIQGADLMNKD